MFFGKSSSGQVISEMWLLTHLRRVRGFVQRICQYKCALNANLIDFTEISQQNTFIFTCTHFYRCKYVIIYFWIAALSSQILWFANDVIVPVPMSFFLHLQLPSLVLSSLLCLPPHPPSAHAVPLPTLPHPCRRHTDCQTPYRPYRCGRVSEAVVQSRRLLPCWRQQPRLQQRQQ